MGYAAHPQILYVHFSKMHLFTNMPPLPTGHLLSFDTILTTPPPSIHIHWPATLLAHKMTMPGGPTTRPCHKESDATTKCEHQASTSQSMRGRGEDRYKNREQASVQGAAILFSFSYILLIFLFNSRTSQHKDAENEKVHPCRCTFSLSASLLVNPSCTQNCAHMPCFRHCLTQ